ncbi:MAG: hypothetical protein ACLU4N_26380 [Butyricimonas faecihominis]
MARIFLCKTSGGNIQSWYVPSEELLAYHPDQRFTASCSLITVCFYCQKRLTDFLGYNFSIDNTSNSQRVTIQEVMLNKADVVASNNPAKDEAL